MKKLYILLFLMTLVYANLSLSSDSYIREYPEESTLSYRFSYHEEEDMSFYATLSANGHTIYYRFHENLDKLFIFFPTDQEQKLVHDYLLAGERRYGKGQIPGANALIVRVKRRGEYPILVIKHEDKIITASIVWHLGTLVEYSFLPKISSPYCSRELKTEPHFCWK
jgi:hypothetical protein